jgi:hypothetical protein
MRKEQTQKTEETGGRAGSRKTALHKYKGIPSLSRERPQYVQDDIPEMSGGAFSYLPNI